MSGRRPLEPQQQGRRPLEPKQQGRDPRDPTSPGITPLGAGREFDAIRRLVARWGDRAVGIGDDAAVLDVPAGERLVASVDSFVERRHFPRGWLAPHDLGWRAATAALSDLAAMAARPIGALVALAIPAEWETDLDALGDGIGAACAAVGAPIVGGNLTRAAELSITTTVLGAARTPLTRSGVRPGDTLYATGRFGGPGAAVAALLRGERPAPEALARFAHPAARIGEAIWLAERGAHAAIDVSDGLAADLGHLAAASGVRLEVALDALPLLPETTPQAGAASGEEYEVVVSAPAPIDASAFAERFGIPLTAIGRAVAGGSEVVLTLRGERVAPASGHDHFST